MNPRGKNNNELAIHVPERVLKRCKRRETLTELV